MLVMSWLEIGLIGLVFVVAFLVFGFFRITRRAADAARLLFSVQEKDIPGLVEECIRISNEKLGTRLDIKDLENSARALDFLLDPDQRARVKLAFAGPGHPGRFVMPLGAFLGELVRLHHPGARWIAREQGGLAMEIPQGATTLTMHPFDKVLKHSATGSSGDLLNYLNVALGRLPAN